jgi:hypothetical protein
MNIVKIGPLAVDSLTWQGPGNRVLTVICKATFTLRPGESPLHPVQQPIEAEDVYLEGEPHRSLQTPGDLVPFKPRAEVVLVGFAFAPRAEPVRSLVVRLVVGTLDKAFEVVGDRAWTPDGALPEPARFTRQALRYERAGGGPDTANPVGVSPDLQGTGALPNLQPAGFVPSRRGEIVPPVGFGPISSTWPGRREKLGQLAALPEGLAQLPHDLDPAYFNCAPRDQQIERLCEDERLVLENLHPQHPRLITSLPRVRPRAFADRGEGLQEIPMVADTLWIDTSAGICTLTWRAHIENPASSGVVVVAMEAPGMPLPWAEVQSAAQAQAPAATQAPAAVQAHPPTLPPAAPEAPMRRAVTLMHFDSAVLPATANAGLPFVPQDSAPSSRARLPVSPGDVPESRAGNEAAPQSTTGVDRRRSGAGLPFSPSPRSSDPLVGTQGDAGPPAGNAQPAWLQNRMGPPAAVVPAPPPLPAAPWSFTPEATPIPPAPRSSPQAANSPWALGPAAVPPPVVPLPALATPRALGGAALPNSASAASDAAADVQARAPAPPPLPSKSPPTPTPDKASRATGEVLELLWYDEARVPRIRAWWEELVTDLDFEDSDPRRDLGAEDPDKARGRHNVFGILSDGEVLSPTSLPRVISAAVNDKGRFTPPLTLLGGELRFPFDEVETLRATLQAATPLAGTDKRLKESIDSMNELLKTPYLQGSTGVVEKLTRDLRDQFRDANRSLPAGYLDGHVERMLLEQRRYAIRKVFGGEFIRALLVPSTPEGGAASTAVPVPVYLPKHLDQSLPMMITMKVRLIAEAHLQQDLYETSPHALRVAALGRSFQLDGRRGSIKGEG